MYVVDAIVLAAALVEVAEPMTTFTGVLFGFAPVQVPLAILESFASVGIIRLLARRRPELLPKPLRAVAKVPGAVSSLTVLMFASGLSACRYEGIDGSVFGAAAESAGRPPTDSLLDLSQGELGLAMSIVILFGFGFVAGRVWERLLGGSQDALPR